MPKTLCLFHSLTHSLSPSPRAAAAVVLLLASQGLQGQGRRFFILKYISITDCYFFSPHFTQCVFVERAFRLSYRSTKCKVTHTVKVKFSHWMIQLIAHKRALIVQVELFFPFFLSASLVIQLQSLSLSVCLSLHVEAC